jgi:hypothetical protein
MNVGFKAKQELVDLQLLGVQMWRIPKELHETGLILWHNTTALSEGLELIKLTLNEFFQLHLDFSYFQLQFPLGLQPLLPII